MLSRRLLEQSCFSTGIPSQSCGAALPGATILAWVQASLLSSAATLASTAQSLLGPEVRVIFAPSCMVDVDSSA